VGRGVFWIEERCPKSSTRFGGQFHQTFLLSKNYLAQNVEQKMMAIQFHQHFFTHCWEQNSGSKQGAFCQIAFNICPICVPKKASNLGRTKKSREYVEDIDPWCQYHQSIGASCKCTVRFHQNNCTKLAY